MHIEVPIEKFLVEKSEPETYKLLTAIKVDKKITHYTCLCNYMMIFVSDKEINCKNNNMLDAFTGINSLEKFKALKLPIAH